MSVAKFRKKPIVIEAIQYDGINIQELWDFAGADNIYGPTEMNQHPIVNTLEGMMSCPPGWWIIKGVNGEFYPCNPDVFAKSYEEVKEHVRIHYTQPTQTTNVVYLPVYPPHGMRA